MLAMMTKQSTFPKIEFTATQRRILNLLGDGLRHTRAEIFKCLSDNLQNEEHVNNHLSRIRKKMRPVGHDIICIHENGVYYYQHVRLGTDPTDE